MIQNTLQQIHQPRRSARSGFTLVELLTVVFIIGALIAILVPSISAARNQAKKVATTAAISAIGAGLEMFKADNAKDFPQTNGYPTSFSHPAMRQGNFTPADSLAGKFPFGDKDGDSTKPTVSGAHWLPAMLMGVDQQGYVSRKKVPKAAKDSAADIAKWYTADGPSGNTVVLERSNLYVDPGNVRTVRTRDIRGRGNPVLYDDQDKTLEELPVIVDLFDQPLLYYAASTHGRDTNMVENERAEGNKYGSGDQSRGPAYFYHQDNVMFTGNENETGWNFGGAEEGHAIAESGAEWTAPQLTNAEAKYRESFARFICDRKLLKSFTPQTSQKTKLRPVNSDSFLLISAGVDGRYGTTDDPKNFPGYEE